LFWENKERMHIRISLHEHIFGVKTEATLCGFGGLLLKAYLVAVVLACTAELQKSLRTSGSLRAAMQALKGIWARTVGPGPESASSRRRSASCSSSAGRRQIGGFSWLVREVIVV